MNLVIDFSRNHLAREESNGMKYTVEVLRENAVDGKIGGIGLQYKRRGRICMTNDAIRFE